MDDNISEKIVQVVHTDHGWKKDEVRVDEVDRLRRGSCSFYTAGHKVRPLSYQLNYAVLKDDAIVSISDVKAISKIVNACGTDAPAGWWAEIVTRFHQDLGSGIILLDATQNTGAVRKIQAAKQEFAVPTFGNEAGSKTITYYLLEPESFVVYLVKATQNPDGFFSVDKTVMR